MNLKGLTCLNDPKGRKGSEGSKGITGLNGPKGSKGLTGLIRSLQYNTKKLTNTDT